MTKQKQEEGKREEYVIQVGPLLIKLLEEQKESIREVTYGSVNPSFYEAGELVGRKFIGKI
jgi:hypothetical protein